MIISFFSLCFNVSRSSGNSNSNLASATSKFGLGLRQFCTKFESPSKYDTAIFLLINFNLIIRNYCLNKTTFILVVAFFFFFFCQ